jgi:hypothetical protein
MVWLILLPLVGISVLLLLLPVSSTSGAACIFGLVFTRYQWRSQAPGNKGVGLGRGGKNLG